MKIQAPGLPIGPEFVATYKHVIKPFVLLVASIKPRILRVAVQPFFKGAKNLIE